MANRKRKSELMRLSRLPQQSLARLQTLDSNSSAKRQKINRGRPSTSGDEDAESSSVETSPSHPPDLCRESYLRLSEEKKKKNLELERARGPSASGAEGLSFSDFGGIEKVIEQLNKEVIVPCLYQKLGKYLGGKPMPMPMPGILLSGPSGCGKTKLAQAIANETDSTFHKISAPSLVSTVVGESEENIRNLFSEAYKTAPSIVFIDEIDAIVPKREDIKQSEQRIVAQLLTCMDECHKPESESESESDDAKSGYVIVIGATNRPDAIDPALRRPGRFDREIVLGVPDEKARFEILSVLTRNLRVEALVDLGKLARFTSGFVGADLENLVNKAVEIAVNRIVDKKEADGSIHSIYVPKEMENYTITMADFEEAVRAVQPSLKREGFNAIPDVKWEDVGGQDSLREEFIRSIVRPIKYPEIYECNYLFSGTKFRDRFFAGCGKTLIAKAVANEAGANFIHIKGPELLNKYVGESELQLRRVFSRARMCSPCIIFFDEVDAITTKQERQGGWVVHQLLKQFLTELDGGDLRQGVFVIGATNRPDQMDPAILRSGRFGKPILVSLPDEDERGLILKALARKKHLDPSVDLCEIAHRCANYTGADLAKLMKKAAMLAIDETFEELILTGGSSDAPPYIINKIHFEQARATIAPLSNEQIRWYQKFGKEKQLPAKSAVNVIEGLEVLGTQQISRTRNCEREANFDGDF